MPHYEEGVANMGRGGGYERVKEGSRKKFGYSFQQLVNQPLKKYAYITTEVSTSIKWKRVKIIICMLWWHTNQEWYLSIRRMQQQQALSSSVDVRYSKHYLCYKALPLLIHEAETTFRNTPAEWQSCCPPTINLTIWEHQQGYS